MSVFNYLLFSKIKKKKEINNKNEPHKTRGYSTSLVSSNPIHQWTRDPRKRYESAQEDRDRRGREDEDDTSRGQDVGLGESIRQSSTKSRGQHQSSSGCETVFVLFAREARRVCSVHGRARVATVRHSGRSHLAHERDRVVQEAAQKARRDGEASQTGRAHFESPSEANRWFRGQCGQA